MSEAPHDERALIERIRREAMDFARIGWWTFGFDGRIGRMDATTLRIFELTDRFPQPGMTEGVPIEHLVHYDTVGQLRSAIRKHGQVRGLEWTFLTKAGNEKCVVQDAYLVHDPDTGAEQIQVVIHDITERKHMEDMLATHARLLEETNADLEERTQDLNTAAYMASHDLQEALNTVVREAEALRAYCGTEAQEHLDALTEAAWRIQRVADKLQAVGHEPASGAPRNAAIANPEEALEG